MNTDGDRGRRRRLRHGAGLVALALLTATCGSSSSESAGASADPSAFFTQTAAGGSLETGTLTLTGIAPSVVAVLDRPLRTIEHIPVADFAHTFRERFLDDPPNAILTAVVDKQEETAVLTISDPVYNSQVQTLTFDTVSIGDDKGALSEFGLATLTIDSGPSAVNTSPVNVRVTQGELEAAIDVGDGRNVIILVKMSEQGEILLDSEQQQLGGYMKILNGTDAPIEVSVTTGDDRGHDYRLARDATLALRP